MRPRKRRVHRQHRDVELLASCENTEFSTLPVDSKVSFQAMGGRVTLSARRVSGRMQTGASGTAARPTMGLTTSAMSALDRSGLTANVRRIYTRVSHACCRLLSARGAWRKPKPQRAARRLQPRRLALAASAARSSAPPRQHRQDMLAITSCVRRRYACVMPTERSVQLNNGSTQYTPAMHSLRAGDMKFDPVDECRDKRCMP